MSAGRNVPIPLFEGFLFSDWEGKLSKLFTPLKGIATFHLFRFERSKPGVVSVKSYSTEDWEERSILVAEGALLLPASEPPSTMPNIGLTAEKRVLIHDSYNPYIPKQRFELTQQWLYKNPSASEITLAKAAKKGRNIARQSIRTSCTSLTTSIVESQPTEQSPFDKENEKED